MTAPSPQRVIAYVDGFNLYFGLRAAGLKRLYWLDVAALAGSLLKPGQQLQATHYFTARIRDNGHNGPDRKRQAEYLEALVLTSTTIQYGHYLEKPRQCRSCSARWTDYEEKMTDVNIATQLLGDAFDDLFDTALVISADSDLKTPIERVRSRFPSKRVIAAFPPRRQSHELKRCATGHLAIGEDKLRQSQLPPTLTKPGGFILARPTTWT